VRDQTPTHITAAFEGGGTPFDTLGLDVSCWLFSPAAGLISVGTDSDAGRALRHADESVRVFEPGGIDEAEAAAMRKE
jgi:hypothetical protein